MQHWADPAKPAVPTADDSKVPPAAPPADAKAAPEKPAEPAKPESKPAPKAEPVKIEIKIPEKLPDGVTIDKEVVEAFGKVAGELGLTQAQADGIVAMQLAQAERQAKAGVAARATAEATAAAERVVAIEKQRNDGIATLKVDPVFGGEKFQETLQAAGRALGKFGGEGRKDVDALMGALKAAGLDFEPALLRICARVDSVMLDDTTASRIGAAPAQDKTPTNGSPIQRMAASYPSSYPPPAE